MDALPHYSFPSMIFAVRLMVLVIMFALAGCSSDSGCPDPVPAPDPLATYKSQVVDWQTCDDGILGIAHNDLMIKAQAKLGERLKCAMITVPMDYDNPAKGDLKIAVTRTAADNPPLRRGAIFFNPGGPGSDGLGLAVHFALKFKNLDAPNNVIAAELQKMSDQYDLIDFSPRGVGASTQLICAGNEQLKPAFGFPYDLSDLNIRNRLYNSQLKISACLKNPITPYINTEQTVRDMDLIRHLLGDEKLNFIGFSYGTWLGAWYAGRFPERAGRMLLDSNVNFAGLFQDVYLIRAMGEQRLYDEVFAPFAARNSERLALGGTSEEVRTIFPSLVQPIWLRGAVYAYTHLDKNNGTNTLESNALNSMITLRGAQVFSRLIQTYPDVTSLEQWKGIISQAYFSPDSAINELAQTLTYKMIEPMYKPPSSDSNQNLQLDNTSSAQLAVRCNDTPYNSSESFWTNLAHQQAVQYPFFGGQVLDFSCLNWPTPKIQKPSMGNINRASEGILMLQSRYDALTPVEGALNAFKQLHNGSMIMVEREYQHGLFPYDTECVDLAVARYFNEGILPDRYTVCDGKTDIIPPTAAQAAKAAVSDPASVDRRSSIYRDLAKDEEITRIIRSMIR